jgi:uncharacterized protein (TIGR02284 family)
MAESSNILQVLHELIQTCKDGETGYTHAAGVVDDPRLREYFRDQSLERARFVQELLDRAGRLGDKPEAEGSVAGTLHRMWFEAKADVGLGDQSVLNSVEQGEDAAKKAYDQALAGELPIEVRSLIAKQAASVHAAHDYVRDLRDGNLSVDDIERDRAA